VSLTRVLRCAAISTSVRGRYDAADEAVTATARVIVSCARTSACVRGTCFPRKKRVRALVAKDDMLHASDPSQRATYQV